MRRGLGPPPARGSNNKSCLAVWWDGEDHDEVDIGGGLSWRPSAELKILMSGMTSLGVLEQHGAEVEGWPFCDATVSLMDVEMQ
jgi:hypothetical protein